MNEEKCELNEDILLSNVNDDKDILVENEDNIFNYDEGVNDNLVKYVINDELACSADRDIYIMKLMNFLVLIMMEC